MGPTSGSTRDWSQGIDGARLEWPSRSQQIARLRIYGISTIPHLDRSDTRSDTYNRGFRHRNSVQHCRQAYLSLDSLRDSVTT